MFSCKRVSGLALKTQTEWLRLVIPVVFVAIVTEMQLDYNYRKMSAKHHATFLMLSKITVIIISTKLKHMTDS